MLLPEKLRPHYSAFLEAGRVLLTGHSHQAWPDAAREGQLEAFDDAARHADDKWGAAFAAADAVRAYVGRLLDCAPSQVALAPNTHELVTRMLSACDLRGRPHLVTTTGEFHSITRQLKRAKGLVDVTWVEAQPAATLAERLAAAVTERTAAVLVSTVLFETSERVPNLPELVRSARAKGAEVLLDAYHAFGVVPFTVAELGAQDAFIVAGGYKYAQWGEGTCFMRVPPRAFEPVLTGWFAGFGDLAHARGETIGWGASGAERFAGSTYDPTSHYRARAVIRFFTREGLNVARLRELSLEQTSRMFELLEGLDVVTPREPERRGGFVSIRLPDAAAVAKRLHGRGVLVDHRGELLRLGPAPYTLDEELERGCREAAAAARAEGVKVVTP
ncbi:MAG: aminotransferase class V-fold PLP-dependent enzyme [Myxococcaceae bacterium]|nr:aminotransferase class V-fold PLP-dependent enzyme [Myxococcaceae bacterium]